MIELTIKTLDSQNHQFSVPNDYTIEQLKEHIAETIKIPSEAQRCIYLGQILQNDLKLAECGVNGKVIHVVQRPPPASAYANNDTPNASNSNASNLNGPTTAGRRFEHAGTMYLGAMAFPSGVGDLMDGGVTFLHPRNTHTVSFSRLLLARNLLRRAVLLLDQLERENYFNSNQEQANSSQTRSGTSNLAEDISSPMNGTGLEQQDVEIRIELPNVHSDPATESVGTDEGIEIPDTPSSNGLSSSEQTPIDDASAEASPNNQAGADNNASGGASREEVNRRRSPRMMATVMGAVLHAQVRLIPFMRLLRQYLLQDAAFGPDISTTHTEEQVQFLYNSVSSLMHYFSHIYHSLSDIMCDFSQPPPRSLRCRPVILQQQHATVLRGPPRGRIIRSPVVAVSRSTSTAPPSDRDASNNVTSATAEDDGTSHSATASVEVVIEEADTTNIQDNHEEVIAENMDVSEPVGIEIPVNGASNGAPGITVSGRHGDTYVIQSMPEGLLPEGIRINSMEATILTPNDDIAAALTGGANQRWRAGIVPAEVLHNMFGGFINQFRQSQTTSPTPTPTPTPPQRNQRSNSADASRQTNTTGSTSGSATESSPTASNNTDTNSTPTTGESNQSQSSNNPTERSIELDITAVSRTFDPFLPCHSHHIRPIGLRGAGVRNSNGTRNPAPQNSSSNASPSTQSSQSQQNSSDVPASDSRQPSRENNADSASADNQRAQGQNNVFNLADAHRNPLNLFSNLFPGFNLGNVMYRRGGNDPTNTPNEADPRSQSSARRAQNTARILSSNLGSLFPGAIHIEIDPLTNDIQTNIVPNPDSNPTDAEMRGNPTDAERRRTSPRRRRMRSALPRSTRGMPPPRTSLSTASTSPTSSWSPSSLSSSDDESVVRPTKTENEDETTNEVTPKRSLRHLYTMIKKENNRHLESKAPKKESTNKFPLYAEDQEASFFEAFKSATDNASFKELIRGGEVNLDDLVSSVRQRLRSFLDEHRISIGGNESGLFSAVNLLINNNLHKMKNLLDSECVKPEIDMVSTICKFNHDSVPELFEYLRTPEVLNDAEFRTCCKRLHFYAARLLSLFLHCITGEDKSVPIRKVLGAIVEELIKNLPKDEEFEQWLRTDLINHVISYARICHPDSLPAFMRHYVVYRLPPVMPVECTVATARITSFKDTDSASQQPQPMEVEDAVQSSSSSESSFMSASSEVAAGVSGQTNVANENNVRSSPARANSPAAQVPEVVLNSEEWHPNFPSEWVPIITRDIHSLRRQGSQPPFSDAYLSGMPSKRRKLIKKDKPDLEESSQLVTDQISQSMNTAGFSASVNAIANHVAETSSVDGNLGEIVKEELKENVREAIVQQSEFLPHRFPDSTKYFMDK